MMGLLLAICLLAAVVVIVDFGVECSDNLAWAIMPAAALIVAALIIGDLLWMAK